MNEILEKLLKSEFLSEDSKLELQKEFQSSVEALRESIVLEEKLKVAQQWTESKMELAESLDKIIDNQLQESLAELRLDIKQTKLENDRLLESIEQFISSEVKELNEDIQLHRNNDKALVESLDAFLTSEISDLKDDINNQKDLEVEYAARLAEEKKKIAEQVATELDGLAEKLDTYLESVIEQEFKELKEDIENQKKNLTGLQIFESMKNVFLNYHVDSKTNLSYADFKSQIAAKDNEITKLHESINNIKRDQKVEKLLSNLSGAHREQMSIILENVKYEKLDQTYQSYLPRILNESKSHKAQLTESSEVRKTKMFTGQLNEDKSSSNTNDVVERALRLSNVK